MPHTFRLRPPRAPKPRENDVEKQLKDWLLARGWYPVRQQSGLLKTLYGRFVRIGEVGIPDYVVLHARYPAFFLETKAPGRSLSPEQERKRWVIQAAYGLRVAVADGLETLKPWLEDHERLAKEQV